LDDFLQGEESAKILYRIALSAMRDTGLPWAVRAHYRWLWLRAKLDGKMFIDQHHSNLFHIETLVRMFPSAIFIYPSRPPVQVVASMMAHEGVSGWYEKMRKGELLVPFPNRFFGLDNIDQLQREPLHRICYYRVKAHQKAAVEAQKKFGNAVRFLDYESLVKDRAEAFSQVFSSEELDRFGRATHIVKSDISALSKYQERLTPEQIEDLEILERADPVS
jgi:hypothetical protein